MDSQRTTNEYSEEYERQFESDQQLAHEILRSLVESTLAEELDNYRDVVQDALQIDEKTMHRIYRLDAIVHLLTPTPTYKRYFRGRRVRQRLPTTTTTVPEPLHEHVPEPLLMSIADIQKAFPIPVAKEEAPPLERSFTLKRSEARPDLRSVSDSEEEEETPQVEEVKEQVPEPVPDHPSVAAIISLLVNRDIDTTGFQYDTQKYEKALVVKGDTKSIKDTLRELGGVWKGKMKAWVFSKNKLLRLARREQTTEEEEPEEEVRRVVVASGGASTAALQPEEELSDSE
jgi:hypothetical protein